MSELLQKWKNATGVIKEFDKWNDLPNSPARHGDDAFKISLAHCTPPTLTRAGQKTVGGTNYWRTETEVEKAILEWLVDNWDTVQLGVRKILQDKERQALLDCEEFVKEMRQTIDAAKFDNILTDPQFARPIQPPNAGKPEDFDDDIPF